MIRLFVPRVQSVEGVLRPSGSPQVMPALEKHVARRDFVGAGILGIVDGALISVPFSFYEDYENVMRQLQSEHNNVSKVIKCRGC